ncbi:MAG: D-mannonate oxidoreductase [Flavobacterium sp. BFFFF2]|nr:MAG: D-mannonate oxidoreductase [Flavobacterium sp. BFFFF2]
MMDLFNVTDRVVIITGGTGVLGKQMAHTLVSCGAHVVLLGRNLEDTKAVASTITEGPGTATGMSANVLDVDSLQLVKEQVLARWGKVDVLINAAGGNMPGATVGEAQHFKDVSTDDLRKVIDLNIMGTVLPSQAFADVFENQKHGVIINISSAAAQRPLSRVVGYALSKAAIENFTLWLAVEMAHKYGEGIRVNAISPGFFIGEQNRALLTQPDGSLTARGQKIMDMTPMNRFGLPQDLSGALLYLCSDASQFVTGTILRVDGGFGASSI